MKKDPERPFLVQGVEGGQPLEFNAATLETAERLLAQLVEQGLTNGTITKVG